MHATRIFVKSYCGDRSLKKKENILIFISLNSFGASRDSASAATSSHPSTIFFKKVVVVQRFLILYIFDVIGLSDLPAMRTGHDMILFSSQFLYGSSPFPLTSFYINYPTILKTETSETRLDYYFQTDRY